MTKYQVLYDLRFMLQELERDLGLDHLTSPERDVLLVAQNLTTQPGQIITSTDIRKHTLVREFAPATYHRALRALIERGLVRRANGSKAKSYVVATA